MDKLLFDAWIKRSSGLKLPDSIARCQRVFETVPGIDQILGKALSRGMDASSIRPLVEAALHPTPKASQAAVAVVPVPVSVQPALARTAIAAAPKAKGPSFFSKLKSVIPTKKAKPAVSGTAVAATKTTAKKPVIGKKTIWIGSGVLGLILIVAVLALLVGRGSHGSSGTGFAADSTMSSTPTSETSINSAPGTSINSSAPATLTADQKFWADLRLADVPELSPGNLGGQLNAKTSVGIFLMFALILWSLGEGFIRKTGQNGSVFFTIIALIAGLFTLPALIIFSNVQPVGWLVLVLIIISGFWYLTISTIKSQSDLSPITVALALFTASLFYVGKLAVVKAIGSLFGATWAIWTHVTSVGGVLTLLMTGRGGEAMLTILILILGLLVIFMAGREVGKNHGHGAALVIGLAIIIVFLLSNWGLSYGATWLINNYHLAVTVAVVLKVVAPVLAWFVSLFASVGIGVALGDIEVGRQENRTKLGLGKTGNYMQNIADFGILGTIIPLFLGVILVL